MRTSWKVGLITWARLPRPRASPRTKVVLPAPRGPCSSTRSPLRRRPASRSPAASVSSGEWLTSSAEVLVAALALLAVDQDAAVVGEGADHGQRPRAARPGADQLDLLAAVQRLLQVGAGRHRHPRRLYPGAHAGRAPELGQLTK